MSEAAIEYFKSINDWPKKSILEMDALNPLLDIWWKQMSEAEKLKAQDKWTSMRVFTDPTRI